MNTRMIAGGLALIVALTGCAVPMSQLSLWQPLVDTGQISDRYYRDREECRQFADQGAAQYSTGSGALGGALLGAALGAALGGVGGVAGRGAMYGSILGTASGAGSSTMSATSAYKEVYRNCLRGRGYQVLN